MSEARAGDDSAPTDEAAGDDATDGQATTRIPGEERREIVVEERCERLGAKDCPVFRIASIDIDGLNWTKPYVVRRELLFEEGDRATYAEVWESVKRIRNTHIFRKVTFDLERSPTDFGPGDMSAAEALERAREGESTVRLRIDVDERWTLRPIFSFNRGGGTQRLVVGVLDINFLGRYLGLGARYDRFGPTNSFLFWAYDPRFLGERLRVGVNAGTSNRIYTLFDDSAQVEGGFLLRRLDAGVQVSREWLWWLDSSFGMSLQFDEMSLDFISDETAELQRQRGIPSDARLVFFEFGTSFGRINEDNYIYDGQSLGLGLDIASEALGSTHNVTRFSIGARLFRRLPLKSNLGLRLGVGFADSDVIQQKYFLGGLDAIRGFFHDQFRGEQYWLAGAEFRIPSLDYRWFVLQHTAFIEVAHVSAQIDDYLRLSGASAGVGVRIIIPKIDGFIARFDYAFPLYGRAASPLSFGGGQFY